MFTAIALRLRAKHGSLKIDPFDDSHEGKHCRTSNFDACPRRDEGSDWSFTSASKSP
jgi:hypothetical protein